MDQPEHWTDEQTRVQVVANLNCPPVLWRLCGGIYGHENDEGRFVPCIAVVGYSRIVRYLRKIVTPESQP